MDLKSSYRGNIEDKYLDPIKKEAEQEERPLSFMINRIIKEYYHERHKNK